VPHDPRVLDAGSQAVGDDGIILVDDGLQPQTNTVRINRRSVQLNNKRVAW
jgi:hypothetical protein